MTDNIIEIDSLNKRYGSLKAVNDLSFKVKRGELFAFLGVNGAGKSTTINIMCGQLSKDSGKVMIDGRDMDREAAKHSNDSAKKNQKLARIVWLPPPTVKVGVSNLISEINRLLKYMDRPMCITECGVTLEEFEANRDEIVRRALADACTQANPRKVTADDVNKILDHIAK